MCQGCYMRKCSISLHIAPYGLLWGIWSAYHKRLLWGCLGRICKLFCINLSGRICRLYCIDLSGKDLQFLIDPCQSGICRLFCSFCQIRICHAVSCSCAGHRLMHQAVIVPVTVSRAFCFDGGMSASGHGFRI